MNNWQTSPSTRRALPTWRLLPHCEGMKDFRSQQLTIFCCFRDYDVRPINLVAILFRLTLNRNILVSTMAACFGPPPLPPASKKPQPGAPSSGLAARRQRRHQQLQLHQLQLQLNSVKPDPYRNPPPEEEPKKHKKYCRKALNPELLKPRVPPAPPPASAKPKLHLPEPSLSRNFQRSYSLPTHSVKPVPESVQPFQRSTLMKSLPSSPASQPRRHRCAKHTRTLSLTDPLLLPPPPLILPRPIAHPSPTLPRAGPMTATIRSRSPLVRSRSESNLPSATSTVFAKSSPVTTSRPFDKCLKALSGSWKNLLQRKCGFFNHPLTKAKLTLTKSGNFVVVKIC